MVETKIKVGFAVLLLVVLLAAGTIAFHLLETYPPNYWDEEMRGKQWTPLDAFYFSAITLTTIGYGELHPTTEPSKILTVFYAIFGVALVLFVLSIIAKWYVQRSQQFEEHEIQRLKNMLRRGPPLPPKEEQ